MCDCRTSKRAGLRTPQDVVAEDTVVLLHGADDQKLVRSAHLAS